MIIKEIKESHLQIIPDTFTFNLVLFGDVKEKIMNPDAIKFIYLYLFILFN